ncbi:MAG TPA: YbjQ family protein [archaeon]|nr:YbjQ family protein [archaeon]
MIITSTPDVPGKQISGILGIVKGNTIQSRGLGGHISAGLRSLVGGEVGAYQKILDEARDECMKRMEQEARKLKADAIVNIRFSTSDVMQGAAEILVYGTAVKLK